MKYFQLFAVALCSFVLGLDVYRENYVGAIIMAVCVFLNYNNYLNAVAREQNQKKDEPK